VERAGLNFRDKLASRDVWPQASRWVLELGTAVQAFVQLSTLRLQKAANLLGPGTAQVRKNAFAKERPWLEVAYSATPAP